MLFSILPWKGGFVCIRPDVLDTISTFTFGLNVILISLVGEWQLRETAIAHRVLACLKGLRCVQSQ